MSTPVLAGAEPRTGSGTVRPYLLGGLAALSVGAAAIHFAVVFEHFAQYTLYGVFFLVISWAQVIWPAVLLWRPSRLWLWPGIAGNAFVIAVYVASRTVGLPFGPDLHHAEPAGALDVVSCVLQFGLIVGCVAVLWRPSVADRPVARRGAVASAAALVAVPVAVLAATSAVMTPAGLAPTVPRAWAQRRDRARRRSRCPARAWETWARPTGSRTCGCTARRHRQPRRKSWRPLR